MRLRLLALLLSLALPAGAATGRSGRSSGKVSGVSVTSPLSAPAQAPAPALSAPALPASAVPQLPASAVATQGREPVAPAAALAAQAPAALAPAERKAEAQAPAAPALEAKPLSRFASLVTRARDWLFPPELDGSYSEKAGAAFFHGTSLKHIEEAAEAGGALTAQRTYVSNKPGYPHGFARTAARKTASPGVVLQFAAKDLEGKLVQGHYSPVAHQDRGKPVELERWYMAVEDLPLSALSADSKRAVLDYFALQRDLGRPDAQAKLEKIARALGEPVPTARPLKTLSQVAPGSRILIPEGKLAREAVLAGVSGGEALLVERDGALARVPLKKLRGVVDAGPAPERSARLAEAAPWVRAEILALRARRLSKEKLSAYVDAEVSGEAEPVAPRVLGLRKLSPEERRLASARMRDAAASETGVSAARDAASVAGPDVPYLFALVDHDFYYHGTTLEDLERLAAAGGLMKPEVSMYSQRAFDSTMYAAERQSKLGRKDNPQVLLQFSRAALSPLTSGKAFEPMLTAVDRGMPAIHAAYVAATAPVPLSLMTEESKRSLLIWARAKKARRPDEPRWARLAADLEKVLLP